MNAQRGKIQWAPCKLRPRGCAECVHEQGCENYEETNCNLCENPSCRGGRLRWCDLWDAPSRLVIPRTDKPRPVAAAETKGEG